MEFGVEVAPGLAAKGRCMAAQSVGFNVPAFMEHGFLLYPPTRFLEAGGRVFSGLTHRFGRKYFLREELAANISPQVA
jgi:hypothetical protein